MSFRHKEYELIVRALRNSNKQIGGVADFLRAPDKDNYIILRHDVDRRPPQSCALAKLEYDLGVRSVYYFRADSSGRFPLDAIKMIAKLGHEVGYHYEDLSYCKGNYQAALKRFNANLMTLRSITSCETVSMHGAPLSKYNNQDLLRKEDIAQAKLLGDAVTTVQQYSPYYLTDTGGRWLAGQTNLRDRLGLAWPDKSLPNNITAFTEFVIKTNQPIYISTHPERWCGTYPGYLSVKAIDTTVNSIKLIMRMLHSGVRGL